MKKWLVMGMIVGMLLMGVWLGQVRIMPSGGMYRNRYGIKQVKRL